VPDQNVSASGLAAQRWKRPSVSDLTQASVGRAQLARAHDGGAQQLPGGGVVPDIVAAGTSNQRDPRELLVVSGSELGRRGQRLLRSLVVGTQELDPTDLAPSRRGDVVPSDPFGERRTFV
jgi:hypothetical protein